MFLQVIRRIASAVNPSYSKEQVYFSEGELRKLFGEYGFKDVSVYFQGYFSPVFAQNIMQPQSIMAPLSRWAVSADDWLSDRLPPALKKLSFNIVITGRFK
jgi:hypothetical protein